MLSVGLSLSLICQPTSEDIKQHNRTELLWACWPSQKDKQPVKFQLFTDNKGYVFIWVVHRHCEQFQISLLFLDGEDFIFSSGSQRLWVDSYFSVFLDSEYSIFSISRVVRRDCEQIQICMLFTDSEDSVFSRVVCRDCERIQICMLFTVSEESVYSGSQSLWVDSNFYVIHGQWRIRIEWFAEIVSKFKFVCYSWSVKNLYTVEWFAEFVSGFKFLCYSRTVKIPYTVEWFAEIKQIQICMLFMDGEESVYSRVVCRGCEWSVWSR